MSAAALLTPQGHAAPDEEKDATQATALTAVQDLADPDLAERVERALRATGYAALRHLAVSAEGGRVLLRGRVSRYYMKQVAQTVALTVPGVRGLRNDLDVVP